MCVVMLMREESVLDVALILVARRLQHLECCVHIGVDSI